MIGWPPIPNIGTFPDGGWGDILIAGVKTGIWPTPGPVPVMGWPENDDGVAAI